MTDEEKAGVLQREAQRDESERASAAAEAEYRLRVGKYLMASVDAEAEYFQQCLAREVQAGRALDFRSLNTLASVDSVGCDSEQEGHAPETLEQRNLRARQRRQGKGIGAGGISARGQQPSEPLSPTS